jgi:hypothetical protein
MSLLKLFLGIIFTSLTLSETTADVTSSTILTTTTPTEPTALRCIELTNNANDCVNQSPYCCFVVNSYGSTRYSGCLDVKTNDPSGQQTFCHNFFMRSDSDGFNVLQCVCKNYTWNSGSYLQWNIVIFIILISLLF